jgi:hypothetical protein
MCSFSVARLGKDGQLKMNAPENKKASGVIFAKTNRGLIPLPFKNSFYFPIWKFLERIERNSFAYFVNIERSPGTPLQNFDTLALGGKGNSFCDFEIPVPCYMRKLDIIGLRYTRTTRPVITRTANKTIIRLKYLSIQCVTVGP